jgi:CRISPR-associated protein Csm5
MRERHVLRAWPLTPIHIGTGEELTPESFMLDGNSLRTFNSFAALSAASDAERTHYQKLLKGGDFTGAQAHLAKLASSRANNSSEHIAVSKDSLNDLRRVLAGKSLGKGGIRPFMRDGGRPILPGSSLKGAFRTAWIDQEIDGKAKPEHIPGTEDTRNTSEFARAVNKAALGIDKTSALEQDPFRDMAVVDAPLPIGRTRYDRATLGKLARDGSKLDFSGTGGIQMHVERLMSLADGDAVEPFEIEVDFAPEAFIAARAKVGTRRSQGSDKRIVPKTAITAESLWAAANRFHADLWLYEHKRFYKDSPAGTLLDRLLAAFDLKGDDSLARQLDAKGLVLLRLGRYGQFESKAVRLNDRRYGVKAATKARDGERKAATFMDKGGTRTTAKVVNEIDAPFGWLLLALPGKGPQGSVSARLADLASPTNERDRAASRRQGNMPSAPSRPVLACQLLFRKGDRVVHDEQGEGTVARDVSLMDTKMDVIFEDEITPEEVFIKGWRRK